jgi:TonB family protein
MRIKSLLTIASIPFFFLTMSQITRAHRTNLYFFYTADKFAQSAINKASSEPNQSKSPSATPTEKAKMGMYNAVMSALSKGSGLTTKSRDHAEKALLLLESPSTDIEFYAKGIAYMQLANDDLAIVNFNKAIELNPQRFISYLSRGLAYRHKENYDRAIIDFGRAIQLELKMASADVEQSKDDFHELYEKASHDIHKLIQLDPEPWFYWFRRGAAYDERGKAYFDKGDYARAIADFSTLIQLDPNHAEAYLNRGSAYGQKDDLDRAIADFDRAIQLNPRLKTAHYNRGLAYKLKGDEDRARADFDKEEQLFPSATSITGNQNNAANQETFPPAEKTERELLPVRGSDVDQASGLPLLNQRALKLVKPSYPALAKMGRASGTVVVEVLIDEEGKVISAHAISGHPLLWGVSVEAAKNSLFSPLTISGTRVKVSGVIQYSFVQQ